MSTTTELAQVAPAVRQQELSVGKDIAFGSVAGVVSKFVEYPFDTIKVRLQSQPSPPRYSGPLDCFRQAVRYDGIKGLYRGVSSPLVGAAAEISTLFMSYSLTQNLLRKTVFTDRNQDERLPLPALIACGATSGGFTSLILNPVELLKCKLQVQSERHRTSPSAAARPGPLALIQQIYRTNGIRGFWHGQLSTLVREVGGTAAYFGVYESTTAALRSRANEQAPQHRRRSNENEIILPIGQQLLAGAVAGMSYNFLFYPADTIKSTMQTEDVLRPEPGTTTRTTAINTSVTSDHARVKRRTFTQVATQIYGRLGIRGFYRGCGLTVCRSAPSSALIFTIYETLKNNFT